MTKDETNTEAKMSDTRKCNKGHELTATGEGVAFTDASTGRTMQLLTGFFACPTCRWSEYAHEVRQPRIFDAEGRRVYVSKDGSVAMHVFEKSGLGRAPFIFEGISEKRGPIVVACKDGITTTVGAPGQPMGVCDYCGTGIAECCHIRSADGRSFIVGNECVRRTGDGGLMTVAKSHLSKLRAKQRKANEAKKLAELSELMAKDEVLAALATQPHPYAAKNYGTAAAPRLPFADSTRLDWAQWNMTHAGTKGKLEVLRFIEKLGRVDTTSK